MAEIVSMYSFSEIGAIIGYRMKKVLFIISIKSSLLLETNFAIYYIAERERLEAKNQNAIKISTVTLVLHAWKVMLLLKDSHVALQCME